MLKIEVGKTYLTQKGDRVKIVSDEYNSLSSTEYSYMGIFLSPSSGWQNYTKDGLTGIANSKYSLVSEYKEPRIRWFGLYVWIEKDGTIHEEILPENVNKGSLTKEEAIKNHSSNGNLVAQLVCLDIDTRKIVQQ